MRIKHLMLGAMAVGLLFSCTKQEEQDGVGELRIAGTRNDGVSIMGTKADTPLTDFTGYKLVLTGMDNRSMDFPKDGIVADLPSGNYTVKLTNYPDTYAPAFADPRYDGSASATVLPDKRTDVSVTVTQANAGIYFKYDESLAAADLDGIVPTVTQGDNALVYKGTNHEAKGYFAAGSVTVTLDNGGSPIMIDDGNTKSLTLAREQLWEITLKVDVKESGLRVKAYIEEISAPTNTDVWAVVPPASESAIEMCLVPAAGKTFIMGSPDGYISYNGRDDWPMEPGRGSDEKQHYVKLTKDFYMSKYEITNAQYAEFLNEMDVKGSAGSTGLVSGSGTYDGSTRIFVWADPTTVQWDDTAETWAPALGMDNYAVGNVTWFGAQAFAAWAGGTLPTEAQWEFACRGDKGTLPFGIGDGTKLTCEMAMFNGSYPYELPRGHYNDPTADDKVPPYSGVGSYPYPNSYGLYDMHGNVLEWCSDQYQRVYQDGTEENPAVDPVGVGTNGMVARGGGMGHQSYLCRSAARFFKGQYNYATNLGFRIIKY